MVRNFPPGARKYESVRWLDAWKEQQNLETPGVRLHNYQETSYRCCHTVVRWNNRKYYCTSVIIYWTFNCYICSTAQEMSYMIISDIRAVTPSIDISHSFPLCTVRGWGNHYFYSNQLYYPQRTSHATGSYLCTVMWFACSE